ncbi:rhomboid family intramembrane serine protease [Nocardia sp. NPDC059240]|uniref:rhomboid family intramembrane serine protease n=1 Tax=Nocardia sp. NPDC059240 TaxID=3346786 RepID=UPI0036D0F265
MGVERFPGLTVGVFVGTAAVNVLQWLVVGVLGQLERSPSGLHRDWWRSGTALFVQDGGFGGALLNLVFLLVLGTVAEQVLPRWRWLIQYFGVGLGVEFIAYGWQPVGGGNSIAVCGLAGGLAVSLWHREERLPDWTPIAVIIWSTAMFVTLWDRAWLPAVLGCALLVGPAKMLSARSIDLRRPVAVLPVAVGLVLAATANIHGAALILGTAAAASTPSATADRAVGIVRHGLRRRVSGRPCRGGSRRCGG